jgi:hypothetical protein
VARFAIVAIYAIVAICAMVAMVAVPAPLICFIVFFKVGMFGGEVFTNAVNPFVFSV